MFLWKTNKLFHLCNNASLVPFSAYWRWIKLLGLFHMWRSLMKLFELWRMRILLSDCSLLNEIVLNSFVCPFQDSNYLSSLKIVCIPFASHGSNLSCCIMASLPNSILKPDLPWKFKLCWFKVIYHLLMSLFLVKYPQSCLILGLPEFSLVYYNLSGLMMSML